LTKRRRWALYDWLVDEFQVLGNLRNPFIFLGFFRQPGFDCLGRGGPG
jgi:hypothetical protein